MDPHTQKLSEYANRTGHLGRRELLTAGRIARTEGHIAAAKFIRATWRRIANPNQFDADAPRRALTLAAEWETYRP
jgi:hypothetical protein